MSLATVLQKNKKVSAMRLSNIGGVLEENDVLVIAAKKCSCKQVLMYLLHYEPSNSAGLGPIIKVGERCIGMRGCRMSA